MSRLAKLAIHSIELYQQHGGGEKLFLVDCNFRPSCSEYAKESLRRFGFYQGGLLAIKRIFRCNQRDLVQKIDDPVPAVLNREK